MTRAKVYRNSAVHVMARMCDTCIFRPGNLMRLRPGRVGQMVRAACRNEGQIPCHETAGRDRAVCRGFFEKHATGPLQIADRLGFIRYREPE